MNFPGRRAYRQIDGYNVKDSGTVTKEPQTGIERGGTTPDYNVKLRGQGERVDQEP